MNYNFHTHTYRCGHASGSDEEYIISAMEWGIEYLGFSDHIPFRYPDGYESYYRVPTDKGHEYYNNLSALRDKYKEQINIKIGFESEYYKEYFPQMLQNAREYRAEYLILGQHFVGPDHPNGKGSVSPTTSYDRLKIYADLITEGINTGYYTYVAHPDLINYKGEEEIYIKEISRICEASRDKGVPLEINFLGIRDNRNYPYELFWKIAGEYKAPVTFGLDAHHVPHIKDDNSLAVAKELVERFNLNYIGMPKIIDISAI